MVVTKTGFSDLTGFSIRQVGKWLDEGMPAEDGGGRRGVKRKIDSSRAIRWLLQRAGGNLQHGELQEARRDLLQHQAEKERIRVLQMAGELLDREDVEIVMREASAIFIRGLEDLPGRLVGVLSDSSSPAEIHDATHREIRALREKLSKRFEELASRRHDAATCSPARTRKKSANSRPKSRKKK